MLRKNIWIFSHNSTPPSVGQWVRHYMFSKYSDTKKFKTTVFASSYIHLSDTNFREQNKKFTHKTFEDVNYCFVNLKNYGGKKFQRVINMAKFCWRLVLGSVKEMGEIPDVIYASSPDPLAWLAAYLISKKHKAEFIVETRDLWPETFVELGVIKRKSLLAKVMYSFERFIYKRADKLVFTFEGGYQYLLEKGIDRKEESVFSINNGVDLKKFEFNSRTYVYDDEHLDDPAIKTIVYTGSLGQANDLFTLMHLALKLKRFGNDDVRILIFGSGLEEERLIKFKEEHHLHNVLFKGRIDKKFIPSILTKANINTIVGFQNNLYRFGHSFNKLFDYIASGRPIVSSVQTNYDLIEKYNLGKTINLKDDSAFYNAMMLYLSDSEENLKALKQRSEELIVQYDYENLSHAFYSVIEK